MRSLPLRLRCLLCAALATLTIGASRAQAPLAPAQALGFVRAADLNFSPDGSKLAYVEVSYLWDWQPHLRLMDVASGQAQLLTPPKKSERSPQWSPDGSTLAFLSNRAGKAQIYLMPAAGGEALALTQRANGVSAFHWSPDGRALAYLAKDDAAPAQDDEPQLADDDRNLARLWIVDPASKATHELGPAGYRIDEFQWLDASHLLVTATRQPRVDEYTDAVYRLSTAGDGAFELVNQPPQPFSNLIVAPDSQRYALRSTTTQGPLARDLLLGSLGQTALKNATAALDRTVLEVKWHEATGLWVRVDDGFYNRLWQLAPSAAPVAHKLPLSVAAFDVARNGNLAFVGEDFDHAQEIYLQSSDGSIRQLGHLQQGWEQGPPLSTAIFKLRSFDGRPVEAALMKPSPAPGDKLPLVLLVHGGPAANFSACVNWDTAWARLLAAHGYAVLMVNPRGSNGYGEDFLKANRGDWGGGDYRDLLAALDRVIAQGGIDPQRLGIGGWSYGGEMSTWAIARSRRFKAAVAGASVFDQQAEFETESDPAGDEWYFGTPWEHPDVFARNSPATYIRNAHTPTLILAGADDDDNPVGQSLGLYRALKHFGVETELVLYPGEGHSPRKAAYNFDMFARILDWYERHLKGSEIQAQRHAAGSGPAPIIR